MPGDNRKKKGGERKDKKNERMREAVQARHEAEGKPRPTSEQPDIQDHKPGQAGDTTVRARRSNPPQVKG
ncbi:MAG: hypothetical protein WAO58_05720 [Fimbriimonadaceae bacterium]